MPPGSGVTVLATWVSCVSELAGHAPHGAGRFYHQALCVGDFILEARGVSPRLLFQREQADIDAEQSLGDFILKRATDLLARIGQTRFALAVFDTDTESVEEAWSRLHAAAPEHRIRVGAAIFDPERPASLDTLLDQAALDLAPAALSMRR